MYIREKSTEMVKKELTEYFFFKSPQVESGFPLVYVNRSKIVTWSQEPTLGIFFYNNNSIMYKLLRNKSLTQGRHKFSHNLYTSIR